MNLNIVQILFQILNFSILLFLLKKYLYRPVLKILEQRAKKIHEGLEAAEKSIEERERIEKEKKKVMVEAEKDATQILEGARMRARKLEKKLSESTEQEIDRRLQRADRLAQTRLKQMETGLQKQFAKTVLSVSESLLKDSLRIKDHRDILKRHIERLKTVKFTEAE